MSDRIKILFVQHELFTWERAKLWSYTWHLGLEEGLKANNVDFYTLVTPWFSKAKELIQGRSFDQVWINDITHIIEPGGCGGPQLQEKDIEWLATLAPVRLGFVMESLGYTEEEIANNHALAYARSALEITGQYMTHIMTPDEKDLPIIRSLHKGPASWFVCPVPERLVRKDITLPPQTKPVFRGTLYGERAKWMELPDLKQMINTDQSPDNLTEMPALFNNLQVLAQKAIGADVLEPGLYDKYLEALRQIRSQSFALYLDGLTQCSSVINFPSYGKIYTGRVQEGMASGRPVITVKIEDRPMLEAVFEDGKDILLYPDDDPGRLAEHIKHVLRDPEFGQRVAMNARDKLLRLHTTEIRVQQFLTWIATGQEPVYTLGDNCSVDSEQINASAAPVIHSALSEKDCAHREEDRACKERKQARASYQHKLRILFISPPYARIMGLGNCRFPLSFGNMATVLAQNGHTVGIYDADFDRNLIGKSANYEFTFTHQDLIPNALADDSHPIWKEVAQQVADFRPDLVGVSAMTTKYPTASKIAGIIKALNPGIKIVIGGHHPSIFGEQLLRDKNIDFAVIGEGELTMLELVNRHLDPQPDFSNVAGLVYKQDGKIVTNPPRALIRDLEGLPIANRDLMINEGYVSDNNIMTSRGCPFNCHYCGAQIIWQRKVRRRSVSHVMQEIEYLFKRDQNRNISFWDDSFTMGKKYTLEMAEALKHYPGMTFNCITRLDLIDEEIMAALKQAGCTNMLFGIESGSEKMLSLMNKKMTREFILKQIGLLRKYSMYWIGFFIMGYPGETKKDILQTLAFMKELDPPYAEINIFNPLPGTKIWNDLEAEKAVSSSMDFSKHSQSSLNNFFLKDMNPDEFRDLALMMVREFDKHNQEKATVGIR